MIYGVKQQRIYVDKQAKNGKKSKLPFQGRLKHFQVDNKVFIEGENRVTQVSSIGRKRLLRHTKEDNSSRSKSLADGHPSGVRG